MRLMNWNQGFAVNQEPKFTTWRTLGRPLRSLRRQTEVGAEFQNMAGRGGRIKLAWEVSIDSTIWLCSTTRQTEPLNFGCELDQCRGGWRKLNLKRS